MQKGFALLAALVFVAFVVAMGTIYLRQAGAVQKLGVLSSSIAQQNALITDAITILQNQAVLVNSDEALTVFLASAAKIGYDGNGYRLNISSESLQNKIAFRDCAFENNSSTLCKDIMSFVIMQSGGSLSNELFAMFNTPSTLSINDASFVDAKTHRYSRFIKIIDAYANTSKDSQLRKINWNDYFSFASQAPLYLDCQNMPLKLWRAISSIYSLSYQDCAQFLKKEPNSQIAKELKLQNFKNNDSYLVRFTITLEQNNTALGKIALDYDIGKKKAVAVEAF